MSKQQLSLLDVQDIRPLILDAQTPIQEIPMYDYPLEFFYVQMKPYMIRTQHGQIILVSHKQIKPGDSVYGQRVAEFKTDNGMWVPIYSTLFAATEIAILLKTELPKIRRSIQRSTYSKLYYKFHQKKSKPRKHSRKK